MFQVCSNRCPTGIPGADDARLALAPNTVMVPSKAIYARVTSVRVAREENGYQWGFLVPFAVFREAEMMPVMVYESTTFTKRRQFK